jgi:hypothetical protein
MGKTKAPRTKINTDQVVNASTDPIKKKRAKKIYVTKLVLDLTAAQQAAYREGLLKTYLRDSDEEEIPLPRGEVREVLLRKTEDEVKSDRKIYRKEYHKRPDVIEKNRERLRKPEVIEKRTRYAAQEHVKDRKKMLSKINRKIRSALKDKEAELYNQLRAEAACHVLCQL